MSKAPTKFGPFPSPFLAAVKAIDDQDMDTVEFMTHRMWNMCGEYDFHGSADDFVNDLCDYIEKEYDVVIESLIDGYYAWYKVPKKGGPSPYNMYCRYDPSEGKDKHYVTFNGDVIASFISLDDAIAFKRSKEE